MTVKELKEKLSEFPDDFEVFTSTENNLAEPVRTIINKFYIKAIEIWGSKYD